MQSRNITPGVPLTKGPQSAPRNFSGPPPFSAAQNFFVTGTTRDASGAALGSCTVYLFLTANNVLANKTTSAADGTFLFYVQPDVSYYALSYLDGSPDVTGATLNTLTGA